VAKPGIPLDDLREKGQKALLVCVIRIEGSARCRGWSHATERQEMREAGACSRRIMEEGVHIRFRPAPF
jgi:hypothetical protein